MSTFVSAPRCFIEIYPYEAGLYTVSIDQSSVLSCTVEKHIHSDSPGSFRIELAPSGPQGTNYGKSWAEVLTPMSLVTIAMQRYKHAQITMIGVITRVTEHQKWVDGAGVRRVITIEGQDFQYVFNKFNYYNLTFLAAKGSAFGAPGLPAVLGPHYLNGSPDQLGKAWYQGIMTGSDGILSESFFNYQGTSVQFGDLMSTWFEPYIQADIEIPLGDYFMVSEGTWWGKFKKVFPYPWYEFFITTAPTGKYPSDKSAKSTYADAGTGYTSAAVPISLQNFPSASPTLVARVNPLPWTPVDSKGAFSMDTTLWDSLESYSVEGGHFEHIVSFSEDEVRNFYVINPKILNQLFGGTNNNISPFIYSFASWFDPASVHRYGYSPQVSEVHWLSDLQGAAAVKNSQKPGAFNHLIDILSMKVTSYHEPTPNMARSTVAMELRPDILPGNKFTYSPFKHGEDWTFYIDGIQHSYVFGGPSETKLTLSRGLPSSVYQDSQMLAYLHLGSAMRQNGKYVHGLPFGIGEGLQKMNMQSPQFQYLIGEMAPIFSTPQAK